MKPYQHINNTKNLINDLKSGLPYVKDKVKQAKRINTLIDCVESFEAMLEEKYYTEVVETLIYSLIYEWFLMFGVAEGKPIPMKYMVNTIRNNIDNGAEQKKREVMSLLRDHELINKLKNNDVFDENFINFDELLNNLVNEFKKSIQWNLKK